MGKMVKCPLIVHWLTTISLYLHKQVGQSARLATQRTRQFDLHSWLERLKAVTSSPSPAERVSIARDLRRAGTIPI